MASHFITTKFTGGMAFNAGIGDHEVLMDASPTEGGIDSGPGPKKLMLTSLAGCTGIDVVSILNKMKVSFSDFTMDVEGFLTEEHPRIYHQVKIVYKIKLTEADRSKMEKAVGLSEDKYCGVMAMFKAFAKVETEIKYE
ncbi:OsmC family protein [Ferruginibacter sp. HRS2-29]|uniref:OsmC family protein n=1 Tax=Ferruginibacter sp. HRS2-29 TaxID=2487334 RepID=UPI0020CE1A41|nr:OsmC family protein [Ferruginibacter sp. HRS2-29]MCP9752315.1 OsmC family peroxiredoxin [Ferruginibacter sp. HRS2-29]